MTTPSDAKVLVFVTGAGANDFINTVIPTDPTQYARLTRPFPNTGQPQNTKGRGLMALPHPTSNDPGRALALGASPFAVHPRLAGFPAAYGAGDLAFVHGVGILVRPLSVAQFFANSNDPAWVPEALGDHQAQEYHLGTSMGTFSRLLGWGGMAAATASPGAVVSFGGSERFGQSTVGSEISLPLPGANFGRDNLGVGNPLRDSRRAMLSAILAESGTNSLTNAFRSRMNRAVTMSDNLAALLLKPIGDPSLPAAINTAFSGVNDRLGLQLFQCAKIIANMDLLDCTKLILYCRLDAFDLHRGQFSASGNQNGGALQGAHADLLGQVNGAMIGLYNAMVALGQNNKVTQVFHSEFGRTFLPNNDTPVGTEHAHATSLWAMGGAVNGGHYGRYPELTANGPDDTGSPIDSQGRFLPEIGIPQWANTLLQWWSPGIDTSNILPTLGNFNPATIGFMQAG
jgi:uncharacterized protein (DUF1501 family)